MKINRHYLDLKQSYLFKTIAAKTEDYKKAHPDADIIRMGIGDVTLPLCPAAVAEMKKAAEEMGHSESFHGYPESYGEDFLINAIQKHYKDHIGVDVNPSEIVVTCGAKEDVSNILDIFDSDNTVLIPDPVYPVYCDTNIMAGRKIKYISASAENDFLPLPSDNDCGDIIYICSPNNPTGAAYTREQLKIWVDFAIANNAVILYDAAYEIFITDKSCPRSIFEVDGARKCAIEFCSFSKTAGFTGVRCGYTVVPSELEADGVRLLDLWKRRQSTKFNGVSYVVQRAAAAVFSDEGYDQILENIKYYRRNTENMMNTFSKLGLEFYGGKNSPYVWLKCPGNMKSWDFFDLMLDKCNIIGTPGEGFGSNGEGYFRLSGFGNNERTQEALKRIETRLGI
ncbi:MAG: LL-diaminopimelate aminotransferase [Clostridiales bacterium]|nr:LL-diaminopimelate aminotransferase [Clostridiales bacterium]